MDKNRIEEYLQEYSNGNISITDLYNQLTWIENDEQNKFPLSEGQKALWALQKMEKNSSAYNIPICFKFKSKIDLDLLKDSVQYIWNQYPILKTIIKDDNGILKQMINNNFDVPLEIIKSDGKDEKEMMSEIEKLSKKPFDLETGPLFCVYILDNNIEQIVLINLHHIITDGTSTAILIKSLLETFHTLIEKKEVNLQTQDRKVYANFVKSEKQMLSGKRGEENQRFWSRELQGDFKIVNFPSDISENIEKNLNSDIYTIIINKESKTDIVKFSKKYGISLSSYFLSILNMALYQCTGEKDITIGMATMGRPEECYETTVGYFVNMIPVRTHIDIGGKYIDYLKNLQNRMFDCIDHADYPYVSIIKSQNGLTNQKHKSLFSVSYYYQNFFGSDLITNIEKYEEDFNIEFFPKVHQKGEYDIVLEVIERKEEFVINLKYNSDLYTKELIRHYSSNIIGLSKKICENPLLQISQYPPVGDTERNLLLYKLNNTSISFPNHKKVTDLFEEQVCRTPDKIAVVYENKKLTYRELDTISEKLAVHLQKMGVKPNTLVGICVERSLEMIVGLLAILKSGGAYVPLDPEYPDERIEYMIENSEIDIILTQSKIIKTKSYLESKELNLIPLDVQHENYDSNEKSYCTAKESDLAYVLYTSGSTGKPKGVMISHEALTNFLLQMAQEPGMSEKDVLLAVTTFCFDISGLELYLPLIKGAKCVICSTENKRNIDKLKEQIDSIKPTIMQATPATWMALYLVGWRNKFRTKILCGGEALPIKLKDFFMKDQSEVWNMFGPTETTIWSTMKKIENNEEITIGKPIANTQIYILNDVKVPVPINVPGELYIAGTGLAKGYYNREDLTKERFIDNPFIEGTKMYRTGDIAKWNSKGEIIFIGRADNQVKIHGFRIELSEIENKLNNYEGIDQSAVIVREHDGNKQLVAYFVGKEKFEKKQLDVKTIRDYLYKYLPVYMIPSILIQIDALPLTPNGKINRLELEKYQSRNNETINKNIEPQKNYDIEHIQRILTDLWIETIGNPNINVDDGFFEVGGDSILAVLLIEKVKDKFGCDLKVTHLFEYSNISNLSKYISKKLVSGNCEVSAEIFENSSEKESSKELLQTEDDYNDSVAIIGISCQLPGASSKEEYWDNLLNKKECLTRIPIEKLKELNIPQETIENPRYMPISLEIEGKGLFDNEFFNISPKDAEYMNPQTRLLLENSWKALEDAGYVSNQVSNTGVYIATSNNSYLSSDNARETTMVDSSKSYVKWIMNQPGTVPTTLSYHLGLTGPSIAVHSNCSSALAALDLASQAIKKGEIDFALVGVATIHTKEGSGYLYVPGMNFSEKGHIKAFDSDADGMLGGEGVAVIMIKNAKKAIRDHDNIYAILRGMSVSNDGKEKAGYYAPSIRGQEIAIENAIVKADINPETISYIEAHGTGTKLGDPIEFQALKHVYEKYTMKKQFCGIGSVKTNVGHLDTVAGIAGCIKLALSLKHKIIPATINFKEPNPEIDLENSPFYIQDEILDLSKHKSPIRVALSSFGIGGTNVHAILEEYIENSEMSYKEADNYIIPISAKTQDILDKYVENIYEYLKRNSNVSLRDISYTLQTGREQFQCRIAFCVQSTDELLKKLHTYLSDDYNTNNKENRFKNELFQNWIEGKIVDWNSNYEKNNIPYKISLPTYPFSGKFFWISDKEKKGKLLETPLIFPHCLLDTIRISSLKRQCYTKKLTGKEFFLNDHIINGEKILPGVIYIEMARAASKNACECEINRIKNIVWSQPISVNNICDVNIEVKNVEVDIIKYRITTKAGKNEIIHSQGIALHDSSILNREIFSQIFPIEMYKERCNKFIDKENFYKSSLTSVYQYGITFRPITELYSNTSETLAFLEIPQERLDTYREFTLHPSILEGGLQSITGLLSDSQKIPFMPYSIEDIKIYRKLHQKCVAYTTYSEKTKEKHLKKFNIKIFDMDGHILAEIRNYTIRNIPQISQNKYLDNTIRDNNILMYHYEWKKEEEQDIE